ncbi:BspA family leucine-rich repeat surface protein [Succinivibrio dextrinosolvens]|uniref:BspA family leucine-rich repeat surface protein n=1 Tax=Succinivibrio dextrinosolvens TaxID=83771 RepID=UPI00241E5BC4|nr:BspA family leucine-rich repeat surface protein [Succinivibrio dextrinosolvens]MBE6422800.1 BspA family leucine-rich repeat surface protein [Succinivibrio dextrinosolvens]
MNSIYEQKIIVTSKKELVQIIENRISAFGPECSLNDLDVSTITDMSELFLNSDFNGDISEWDVFNVEDMSYMFSGSKFSKDISSWNIIRAWKTIETAFKNTPFEDNPFELFDFFIMDRWHEDILKKGVSTAN